MYIPPCFLVIACEPMDEDALHSWAASHGGVWRPAGEGYVGRKPSYVKWEFEPGQKLDATVTAHLGALTDEETVELAPLMHRPPQGTIEVELSRNCFRENEAFAHVLLSLLHQWDGYAYDFGCHGWVSELLQSILSAERIIRYEPPPPGPLPPWIWINGKYTRNEAYFDNLDANAAAHENQL